MSCDIVLVNPQAAHGIYGVLAKALIAVEPPTWLRLIAACLRTAGWRVAVIDGERDKTSAQAVSQHVERLNPRFVALITFGHTPSAATQQMFGTREVATAIKTRNSDRKLVVVGGHVSALPVRTLEEEPIDFAVVGEGPVTLRGLLEGLALTMIPGLVWRRDDGQIVVNRRAESLDLVTDLVNQGWDLTPPTNYISHNWHAFGEGQRSPYASIVTSFNCPYACSFCQIRTPFGAPGYKTRAPETIVDEIEMLVHEHGVRLIKFSDEMYLLKPSHYLPIAQGLIDRNLGDKINCWVYGRVDSVKSDTLDVLRRSGVRWIALGIESGDPDVRDGAEKRLRQVDIVGVVRRVQAAGIAVVGNFMFGFENDTLATMRATLDLALECLPEWANFYCTMALPGSKLYNKVFQERPGDLPPSWQAYSQHATQTVPLRNAHLTAAEILDFRDRAHATYFSSPRYLAMLRKKFGHAAVMTVERMLSHRLERDLLRS